MALDQVAEVFKRLCFAEHIDALIEVLAHPADGARVGFHGFGLQALECEMFQVLLIALGKARVWASQWCSIVCYLAWVLDFPQSRGEVLP